jgi:hypothetical protein
MMVCGGAEGYKSVVRGRGRGRRRAASRRGDGGSGRFRWEPGGRGDDEAKGR